MRVPGPIRRNIGLKLTSVLLSVIIYLHVYTDRVHETKLWLPVEFKGRPDSLAVTGPPPARALVLLRGRGKELLKLRWRVPVVEIDLSGAASGRFNHSLSVADVKMTAASEATPLAILEPRLVTIELDRITTRTLPLALRFTGALPAGYLLGEIRMDPSQVTVRGPSKLLPVLDSLEVGPVDLRGLRGRAEGLFTVRVPSPDLAAVPPQVRVELGVYRAVVREIGGINVRVLADSMLVGHSKPERATLQISGWRESNQALEVDDLEVIVDARGLGPGVHDLPGQLTTAPPGVSFNSVPDRFRVTIERQLDRGSHRGSRESGATEQKGREGRGF